MIRLTIAEMERNPGKFINDFKDAIPKLEPEEDGTFYHTVPHYENGQYGTKNIKLNMNDIQRVEPGDEGYSDDNWGIENMLPEGWTVDDRGDGTPSMEGYMVEVMGLPKKPQQRNKPQGF